MKIRNKYWYFFAYGIFWILYFEFARILFLSFHHELSSALPFTDLLLILLHGFKMDLSMSGYLMLIPGLVLAASPYVNASITRKFLKIYTGIFLAIISFLTVSDMELYRHWGFRLDDTPLLYLKNPKEVMGSSDPLVTILLLLLSAAIFFLWWWLFHKFISPILSIEKNGNWKTSLAFMLITPALILPIRGSLGQSNMNIGFVYFHKTNIFANHAAINAIWNVAYALKKTGSSNYPKNFYNSEETEKKFRNLYVDEGEPLKIFRVEKPNIIVIALESYTSKIIESLGGVKGVTPNIDGFAREGILFSNIFSSGDRTDKGAVSIFSGYPAQPKTSIMKLAKKTYNLPFINKELKKIGYHSGFTFGYDIDYANFRSYLSNARFDDIRSIDDFTQTEHDSKWGIHDHVVLERVLLELDTTRQPFFKGTMTLSSHEPFDVPMDDVFPTDTDENKFLNSAYYTDKSIGNFIEQAKTRPWWKNTVIILIADHGSRHPHNDPIYVENRFRVPMIWAGGAMQVKDTVITTIGSQTDIAHTLLSQLDLDAGDFEFSKDLLAENASSFAFYAFNNGFGFVTDSSAIVFDNDGREYMIQEGNVSDTDRNNGKAYMQKIYTDFNAR